VQLADPGEVEEHQTCQDAFHMTADKFHHLFAESNLVYAPIQTPHTMRIVLGEMRVKAGRIRVLVGLNVHVIDRMVCEDSDHAYDPEFYERFATEAGWYPGP
jgi:hypothetical protein